MIIPRPAELVGHPGEFAIGPAVHLVAGPGAARAARLLAGYLGPDRPRTDRGPRIRLGLSEAAGLAPQGYELVIRPDRVDLAAPDEAGLFNGVQTLRQLLPTRAFDPVAASADAWRWPCLTVRDAPRLPWRGAMLDVARHFMPLEFLYEFVDLLALHKLNVLHLHLTDDQGWRIEIDGLPRLTEVGAWRAESMVGPAGSTVFDGVPHGGYYTQAELRALVGYAEDRGVTIVPEIEMPGHARAILAAYPQLGNEPDRVLPVWTGWGISEDVLGVHDEVLEFCRTVLAQVIDVFPSRYIHIGGDECPTARWRTSARARRRARELGLADPARLHGWFLRQMRDFLAEHGRRAVCWDEADQNGDLDVDMVLASWRDPAHGARAVERGHQVVMAPHLSTYLDYPQRDHADEPPGNPNEVVTLSDVYRFDPLAGGLPVAGPDGGAGVLGAQAQLWTEHVQTPDHARYLMFPRLSALAEVAWSDGGRDIADFNRRLVAQRRRLGALGMMATGPLSQTVRSGADL